MLANLGLRFQLGHPTGIQCPFRIPGHSQFIALHVNGIHRVAIDFCGCPGSSPNFVQLLRASMYPATPLEPQTCATFEVLRNFHAMTLQGKISAFDYYHALVRLTDGYGLEPLPVSFVA